MKNLEEIIKKLSPPAEENRHESIYKPPEKDISSKISIIPEKGLFIKTKQRSHEKALWEFYMLYIWNKAFERIMRKNKHLEIKIKVPKPYYLEIIDEDKARLYMEFVPGLPIKKYSEKSKKEINSKKIKIKGKYRNLIEAITFGLGILCRIKSDYCMFHGDMDFRHIFFDYETLTLSLIDLEKAMFYHKEFSNIINKDELSVAVDIERHKVLNRYLKEKFSHLEEFNSLHYIFNLGSGCLKIKKHKNGEGMLRSIKNDFFERYGEIENILQSTLKKIRDALEGKY